MVKIASDGGYLAAPVALDQLTLAPGDRVEVIVDATDGPVALLDATIARDALQGIEWAEHDAWVVLTTAAPDLTVHLKGVTKQLSPIQPADGIDLTAEAVRPVARPLP